MPRKTCSNPYGTHRSQMTLYLRPVTNAMLVSGAVKLGELVCHYCRMKLIAHPKPTDLPSTSRSTDVASPEVVPEEAVPSTSGSTKVGSPEVVPEKAVPSTSGIVTRADNLTSEVSSFNHEMSMDESVGDLSADESSADESTATESTSEVDEETAAAAATPILNEILPNLGESPVKRSK